jgi:NADH:ubiquinone oxidoreductase subunit 6 (subunit J)
VEIAVIIIVMAIVMAIGIIIVTVMTMMKLTAQRKLEELTGLDLEQAVMILVVIVVLMTMIVAAINADNGGYPIYFGTRLF